MQTDPTPSSSSEPQATTAPATTSPINDTGAPTKKWRGREYPDLYEHMPARFISMEEARLKRWPYFYEGRACVHGHLAPRAANKHKVCVDCARIRASRPPIGLRGQAPIQKLGRPVGSRHQTLRDNDKEFLIALAELKSFDAACAKAGLHPAEMRARVSSFPQLRAAVNDLERRIGAPEPPAPEPEKPKAFAWSDEARAKFVEAYVDTGDIASARDAIGVTPSEYYRELERNPAFGIAVKSAEHLAMRALEERAIQLSLKGNDKLLQKLLAAKMPEQYSERVRLDVKQETTVKLDDRALNARLASLLSKHKNVLDAEFTELEPGRPAGAIAGPRGD